MATFPLPIIRPEEHQSFRDTIGPDIADTYNEWLKLHAQEINEHLRRGETIVEIEVEFDEFIRFCRARDTTPNKKALHDLAIEKAARQN